MPLKFGLDIQSKTKVRVCTETENPIWPSDGHIESDNVETQQLTFSKKKSLPSSNYYILEIPVEAFFFLQENITVDTCGVFGVICILIYLYSTDGVDYEGIIFLYRDSRHHT